MSTTIAQQLREQLTFEQQARFDAMYEQRAKKAGTATVLALPLLGTFGLEHFYLGNTVRGVLSFLFSWTLIPTIIAIIDLLSGDIGLQVAHANNRVAQTVYQEVLKNTIKTDAIPAAALPVVAPPVAPTATPTPAPVVAAPSTIVVETVAVITPVVADAAVVAADSIPDVAPVAAARAATVVADAQESDETTTTTATFTQTQSAAAWQAGMDQPITTNDSQTLTFGDTVTAETGSAVVESAPAAVVAAPSAPVADVFGDAIPQAPITSDDTVLGPDDGVLAFVADTDTEPAEMPPTTVVAEVQVDQTAQQATQETITEADHVSTQHYVNGKLVEARRADATLTGEINRLITDHTSEDRVVEATVAAAPSEPIGWVDVSPLQGSPAASTSANVASRAMLHDSNGTGESGTNVPGGNLGNGGTNVPGGDLGGGSTDVPSGGLGSTPSTGDTPEHPVHNPGAPIEE